MRDVSIHNFKKITLMFLFYKMPNFWLKLKGIEFYFNRFLSRSYRAKHYRKQIDGYLNKTTKLSYEKISKKIEREIFKRTKFKLTLTSKWWLLFFGLIDSKNKSIDINKSIDDLFNETLCIAFSQNSSVVLLELYAFILEYGLYSVGCIIRCQAAKLVLEEGFNNNSSQNIIERYLSAAFEEGRHAELQDSLEKLFASNTDNKEIFLLNLLLHKIILKASNKKIINDEYLDRNYLEIIKGKRIAIVGPSPSNLMNGKEIDAFDVIVRFNYKGENLSTNYYGSRTDISYFNGANSRDVQKNYTGLDIAGLKAAVYKIPVEENLLIGKCNRRMPLPIENFMLDNSPYALQNVVADLLLYNPLEIKVFSIDMFLTNNRDISYGVMDKSYWDNFYPKAGHDPYSNYLFIEYLYNNNFISVDSKLKRILDMEISEYMEELQNTYFDKALSTANI